MAKAAADELAAGNPDTGFLEAKQVVARHFFERRLPDAPALARRVKAGADTLMALPEDAF
jgi:hypothetical protein